MCDEHAQLEVVGHWKIDVRLGQSSLPQQILEVAVASIHMGGSADERNCADHLKTMESDAYEPRDKTDQQAAATTTTTTNSKISNTAVNCVPIHTYGGGCCRCWTSLCRRGKTSS